MAEEKFETNLLRMIAAEIYFSLSMQAAREMYGKSYFSLGISEKAAIDQQVLAHVGANYQQVTPEILNAQAVKSAMGFQAQSPSPPPISTQNPKPQP